MITASQVKVLREKTGVGLMECKRALEEVDGNIDSAVKILRERGLVKALSRSERTALEGRIFARDLPNQCIMLTLNCETDFVSGNSDFKALGDQILTHIAESSIKSIDELKASDIEGVIFESFLAEYILKIGENISVSGLKIVDSDFYSSYVHLNGKIGVIVKFSKEIDFQLGKDVAMQVAATNPICVSSEQLPDDVRNNESEMIRQQLLNEGKPEAMIDKILQGKLQKYYQDVCLIEQFYIRDDKKRIRDILPSSVSILEFFRTSI